MTNPITPRYRIDPKAPGWRWDKLAEGGLGGFIDETSGRLIPETQVRARLDQVLAGLSDEAKALSAQLADGAISLTDWEAGMRSIVKSAHLNAAAAAQGGYDLMTAAEFGRAGGRIRSEYSYLSGFAGELADGTLPPTAAGGRAAMYGQAGRGTYYGAQGAQAREAGHEQERTYLSYAEHCDECVGEAEKGWVPIGALIPIGKRACLSNCRCHIRYRPRPDLGGAIPIWQEAAKDRGITYNVAGGYAEKSGIPVATHPELTQIAENISNLDDEQVGAIVANYVANNYEMITSSQYRLGLWWDEDTDDLWMDVSQLFSDVDEAKEAGIQAMQNAIFNLDTKTPIPTGIPYDAAKRYFDLVQSGRIEEAARLRARTLAELIGG